MPKLTMKETVTASRISYTSEMSTLDDLRKMTFLEEAIKYGDYRRRLVPQNTKLSVVSQASLTNLSYGII